MERKVVWTERASGDIEAIVRYLARRDPSAAGRIGLVDHVFVSRIKMARGNRCAPSVLFVLSVPSSLFMAPGVDDQEEENQKPEAEEDYRSRFLLP